MTMFFQKYKRTKNDVQCVSLLLSRRETRACVELEEDDVAVVHDVVAALLAVLAGGLGKENNLVLVLIT